jgi:hypothetical protein
MPAWNKGMWVLAIIEANQGTLPRNATGGQNLIQWGSGLCAHRHSSAPWDLPLLSAGMTVGQ